MPEKNAHRQPLLFPFVQTCLQLSAPWPVLLQGISVLICTNRRSPDCARAAPQLTVLACLSLQPLAWFTGAEMRGQFSKAPSGVRGETLDGLETLPQGFQLNVKSELFSGGVSFSPFCSEQSQVAKCLYQAPGVLL